MDAPWRLVPSQDAGPPPGRADARARGWWRDLIARLRPSDVTRADVGPGDDDLQPIEHAHFERLAPPPPLASQHEALDSWRDRVHAGVALRPDDGGWDAALGGQRPDGVEIVAPPDGDAVPGCLTEVVVDRLVDPEPLHLTRFEGWFVRHHDDLTAFRELLTTLHARRGPWTADVSPRAWGWLRAQLPEAGSLPAAWAPAALDGEALAAWLGGHDGLRERSTGQPPDEAFFRALAARSAGQAGAARAIWSACLRDGAEGARAEADTADPTTVWVRAPGDVDLPDVSRLDRVDLLVVHALMLHGPVSTARIERAMASVRQRVAPALQRLAAIGVTQRDEDQLWRLRPEAVPALNARLDAEAFLGADP